MVLLAFLRKNVENRHSHLETNHGKNWMRPPDGSQVGATGGATD